MQTTQPPRGDLRALAREPSPAQSSQGAARVPPPKFPWKTRVLVPGAIIVTLLLLLAYTAKDALFPARAVRVVPVVVKAAGEQVSSAAIVQAPGWVEADPYPIAVTALAGGVVKEVLALEGQAVKAGDVVARLIDDDAKLALAKSEAQLAEKQAGLEAAQRQWDNPVERTRAVNSGEARAAEAQAEIEKHHADLAVEEAKLIAARDESERLGQSTQQRATSEIELIRARQKLAAQEATRDAMAAHGNILEAQLRQREADVTAAKENQRLRIDEAKALAEAKAAVSMAQAARDEAALRLSRMEVRSPANGIVMQRLVEPGAKLLLEMDDPRSAQALRLYDPKRLQVRVDVPLADAGKVGVEMDAQIVVGVLPDRTFKGKVSRIVNEADIQKNTLQVKVAIADPTPQLKPEMLARVRFSATSATTAPTAGQTVFAPLELIHRMGDSAMAWVIDPRRGVAVHRTVQLGGAQIDGWTAVVSGLSPGDQLIADSDSLRDGQRVRVSGEAAVKGAGHGAD